MTRPLYVIAADIRASWQKPNYAAKPYIEAMAELNDITDRYMYDSAKSVVLYFLSNASGWKGETAKRVKAELKAMVK
jgi:hypothetical protein